MKKTRFYKGHRWTNDELKKLMQLWAEGESVVYIADELNSSKYAIQKMVVKLRKEGIPLERRRRGHVAGRSNTLWTQAEAEYLVRRRYEKATIEEIASELGRSWSAVSGMTQNLRKEGVSVPMYGHGVRRLWNSDLIKKLAIEKDDETAVIDLEARR